MDRININIDGEVSVKKALWYVLNGYSTIKPNNDGVVTFKDDNILSMDRTDNGNLTFTVTERNKK